MFSRGSYSKNAFTDCEFSLSSTLSEKISFLNQSIFCRKVSKKRYWDYRFCFLTGNSLTFWLCSYVLSSSTILLYLIRFTIGVKVD